MSETRAVLRGVRLSVDKGRLVADLIRGKKDHPHGGGEGRTGEGRHAVDPWGNLTKGYRTRNNKRTQVMIVSRRKK